MAFMMNALRVVDTFDKIEAVFVDTLIGDNNWWLYNEDPR